MRDLATYTALARFGLGAGPGDEARLGGDPRGWLLAQIDAPFALPAALASFRSSDAIITDIQRGRVAGRDARRLALRTAMAQDFRPERQARMRNLVRSEAGFAERMVLFWSNHFSVSINRRMIAPAIPAYEREAIRPHVFGRFAEMLRAVVRHPVMLTYLDNLGSVGPNSLQGRRRRRRTGTLTTLNENLAREVLELHTLGVDGGYSQTDVIEFAKTLTGWGHGGQGGGANPAAIHGRFRFRGQLHEPGIKTVLGRRYREAGAEEAERVLDDLARHPATAHHLATKLVRHFVADDPPPEAVARIAGVYRDSDGDLAEVSRALVGLEQAWATPLSKLKTPTEFTISAWRAAAPAPFRQRALFEGLQAMGQMPFSAPSPAGWGDRAGDWLSPESLMLRIEWARRFAARLPAGRRPDVFLDACIGPVAGDALHQAVANAASGDAALALVLVSPEFLRR